MVNVASECGYTDTHYRQMVAIQNKLKDHPFVVLAFPCNQFGNQEPYSSTEVEAWAIKRYKINFPLFAKINVRGNNQNPLYAFIKGNKFVYAIVVQIYQNKTYNFIYNFELFYIIRFFPLS